MAQITPEKLQQTLTGLMATLAPANRARAASQMARALRGSNAKRIASQKDPDGQAFAPRKAPSQQTVSSPNATKKFLYPSGGSGAPRVVLLKSYHKSGPLLTGYDREAEGIRSFERSKIIKYLSVTPEEANKGARRPRSSVKSRIMFRKLRTFTNLKTGADENEAWVGFSGRAADIAKVHQLGDIDRPAPKAPLTRYPERRLLGLSQADQTMISNILMDMITL